MVHTHAAVEVVGRRARFGPWGPTALPGKRSDPATQDSHLQLAARSCGPWLSLLPSGLYRQEFKSNEYAHPGDLKGKLNRKSIALTVGNQQSPRSAASAHTLRICVAYRWALEITCCLSDTRNSKCNVL